MSILPPYSKAEATSEPFRLEEEPKRKASTVMARVGSNALDFMSCPSTDISAPYVTFATHSCSRQHIFEAKRSMALTTGEMELRYARRTTMLLIATYLVLIPDTLAVRCKPGVNAKDVGLRETNLKLLKNTPHTEALHWRWNETQKEWKIFADD